MDGLEQDRKLLKELVEFAGLTPTGLAKKVGLAVTTITRTFNGKATTRLSQPTLERLRSQFPSFPGWSDFLPDRPNIAYDGDMVDLGEIDLRFGLGSALMDEEVLESSVQTRSFPRAWLRHITHSPPSQLYWAKGQGNSMEPNIGDGDIILIDRSQLTPSFGDLYWAVAYGHTGMVKRLRPMPDGSVKIISDNPNVPPETAYDGELHIFGRVIAVVKRI